MIELVEGFYVDPWEVKIVRAVNEKSCALFVTGEGYLDGHILPYPASEVVEAIEDARVEEDGGAQEEDGE